MVNDRQSLDLTPFADPAGGGAVEWRISDAPVPYPEALAAMEARAADIGAQRAPELVWLLEHPPLYTSGTSGKASDLLDPRFPMFATGRGGQLTYHGPGQRVAYVMLDLKRRRPDVRAYVAGLEEWIIRTLAAFNVRGERREDRVGVWVSRPDKGFGCEDKIAAIGVRLRRWVSLHGISINVEPDLTHFDAIVPCGVADPRYGVTSLVDLGHLVTMADVDIALRQAFVEVFGAVEARQPASDGLTGLRSSPAPKTARPAAAGSARRDWPLRPGRPRPAPMTARAGTAPPFPTPHPPAPQTALPRCRPCGCAPSPRDRDFWPDDRPRRGSRRPAPGR